jgi:hypothetical protein
MSNKKQYIEIEQRMTLNAWKDGVADTRENREFQILSNYLPLKGEIRTREGITLFTHTPSASDTPWFPHESPEYILSPSETAVCKAVFRFESTATIGLNSVDAVTVFTALTTSNNSGSSTVDNTNRIKDGLGSLLMTTNTVENTDAGETPALYGLRSQTEFPSYFIGDTGGTTTVQLWTYWFYPLTASLSSNAEWHMQSGNSGDITDVAMGVRAFDKDLQAFWTDTAGGTVRQYTIAGVVEEDRWHFAAAWFDSDNGNSGLYHYDDVSKVETYTARNTETYSSHFLIHCSQVTIGGKYDFNGPAGGNITNASDGFHGNIDYFTVWDSLFTNNSSNITLIRIIRDLHKS